MATFKPGDKVQSKGIAGPEMLVSGVTGDTVYTFWFSGKKKEAGGFHVDTVELVPPPPPPATATPPKP